MRIEKREATRWVKCVACGEQIRTCEKYLQVVHDDGSPVRGERYCLGCEDVIAQNNDIDKDDNDGERHLRQMEDYAAYQYNGCTAEYWTDRDAGYCD